jgi:type I restriction enzyme S subunit
MKPYPEYRDSGVEWIGMIPVPWKCYMLKRSSRVKRGASPRPIDDPKYFDDSGEFGWVRIADVSSSERYLLETTQTLSELGASLSVKRYPDDFFLSIAGSVGKPIITKIKCCIHDGFVWFPDLEIDPEYLYYIFSTGLPYQGLGKWGTQLNLNTDTVGEIYVPIPSPEEIRLIAKYLDHKTAKIDTLIEKKKMLIELLKEERTAVINQAVTKGLDPNVPMKDSGVEWLGEIPEHWEIIRLKYLSDVVLGKMLTPVDKGGYYFKPYLRAKNLTWLKVDAEDIKEMWFSEAELSQYRLLKDDLLVSEGGEVGRTCIWNEEIPECYIQNSANIWS